MPTRRGAMTGPAAGLAVAILPAPSTDDLERRVRALLVANVERATAELEAVRRLQGQSELIQGFHGYGLHLDREELRLFDQGGGAWRHTCRLPTSPGAPADIIYDVLPPAGLA